MQDLPKTTAVTARNVY